MTDAQVKPYTQIKGLSDRVQTPRAGRIRLGIKKKAASGAMYPAETEYFVFDEAVRGDFPKLVEVYGPEPRLLDVVLVSNDPADVFPQAYKFYGKSTGLRCIGDGEHCDTFVCRKCKSFVCDCADPFVDQVKATCPGRDCPVYQKKQCSERGSLSFMLPRISVEGVFQIDTNSYQNIIRINSGLQMIRAIAGRIDMVELNLRRVPVQMKHEGKVRTHYLLSIGFAGDLGEVQRIRGAAPAPAGLIPPPQVDVETGEVLDGEPPEDVWDEVEKDIEQARDVPEDPPPEEPATEDPAPEPEAETSLEYPPPTPFVEGHAVITDQQVRAIRKLVAKAELSLDDQRRMLEPFDRPGISALSAPQACDMITWLNKVVAERAGKKER